MLFTQFGDPAEVLVSTMDANSIYCVKSMGLFLPIRDIEDELEYDKHKQIHDCKKF